MSTEGVPLRAIAEGIGSSTESDAVVTDVHHDSRAVGPGSLFVAIPGAVADGHDYVAAAVAGGAAAVIVEHAIPAEVPQLVVDDSRRALALAAAIVHGHPARDLSVVGVTGTNGKTTVTHMIEGIARASGRVTGLIGTLGARVAGERAPLERTTPESSDVQRLLARMVSAGVELAAMEVSSHALALRRADAIEFAVAAFTNLSQDHLDFHGDMESYYCEKARLFEPDRAGRAVISVDDPWGERLADEVVLPVVRVSAARAGDVYASDVHSDARGSRFTMHAAGGSKRIRLPLPARFNVENALVAAATCLEAGIAFDDVCRGLAGLDPVPGRFELVPGPWRFSAVVDYAHTPEAIVAAVGEARALTRGKVIAVVGAGGDRDRGKRPLMGAAAGTADLAVVTSDNPRSEDPAAIAAAVAGGVADETRAFVEIDRRVAIRKALRAAGDGDIVLVLGKGHEEGQDFGGGRVEPFNDREVVAEEGAALIAGGSR